MGSLKMRKCVKCCDDTCKNKVVGDKGNSGCLFWSVMGDRVDSVFASPNRCSLVPLEDGSKECRKEVWDCHMVVSCYINDAKICF